MPIQPRPLAGWLRDLPRDAQLLLRCYAGERGALVKCAEYAFQVPEEDEEEWEKLATRLLVSMAEAEPDAVTVRIQACDGTRVIATWTRTETQPREPRAESSAGVMANALVQMVDKVGTLIEASGRAQAALADALGRAVENAEHAREERAEALDAALQALDRTPVDENDPMRDAAAEMIHTFARKYGGGGFTMDDLERAAEDDGFVDKAMANPKVRDALAKGMARKGGEHAQ
jgi:hypothetical protein